MNIFSKRNVLLFAVVIVCLTLIFLFNPTVRKLCCAAEYQTFTSPAGDYYIKVYRVKVFPMMMPGSAGDAPGFVRLYTSDNNILAEKDVDMVQLINDIEWSKDKVYIKLFVEWDLPGQ